MRHAPFALRLCRAAVRKGYAFPADDLSPRGYAFREAQPLEEYMAAERHSLSALRGGKAAIRSE